MQQIEFGFNISNRIPFSEEIAFAKTYGFLRLQLWYDNNGFSAHIANANPIRTFQACEIPLLIHAVLDVCEIEAHLDTLSEYLATLNLTELVIHPVSRTNITPEEAREQLCYWGQQSVQRLVPQGVTVYFENNSKLSNILQTNDDLQQFFARVPRAELLLDIAHMDDYAHLQHAVDTKYPRILHIADRHLENAHEHLPIGDGNIDFRRVFGIHLKDFTGTVIIEGPFNFDARLRSKHLLERILQSIS